MYQCNYCGGKFTKMHDCSLHISAINPRWEHQPIINACLKLAEGMRQQGMTAPEPRSRE